MNVWTVALSRLQRAMYEHFALNANSGLLTCVYQGRNDEMSPLTALGVPLRPWPTT